MAPLPEVRSRRYPPFRSSFRSVPRPLKGSVKPRRLADGRISYDVVIRKKQVLVGYSPDWDERSVQRLLDNKLLPMAKLRQPWWDELAPSQAQTQTGVVPTFAEAASDYVHMLEGKYENPNTLTAAISPIVSHVGPFFSYAGERTRRLDEVTGPLVSDFTREKQAEREILRELPHTLAELDDATRRDPAALAAQLDAREFELLERYGQRGGRFSVRGYQENANGAGPAARKPGLISLSSRGLRNNEINRCLARLRDVIRLANAIYGLTLPDPTVGRRLPGEDPPRSWLRPHHLQAIFDAAKALDSEARADFTTIGRYEACVVLAFTGVRVSEFGGAVWRHTHLDTRELHIPEGKTTAGERDIRMHPPVEQVLRRRRELLDPSPTGFLFATSSGRRRDRNSVRNRLLAPALARAKVLLEERGQRPLPDRVTPHTFRRTYLTYLSWAGFPERFAMQQAGHKDAKLTLEIYQQPLPDDPAGLAQVRQWLGVNGS